MKTYIIGDIHGGYKALIQIMERSPFNPTKDKLICLGDYVDGWPQSAEVVQFLIDLENVMKDRLITIKGNHDAWCYDWLLKGSSPDIWLEQGGKSTVKSYIDSGLITSLDHKKFLGLLRLYYVDDQNRGFIHGGFLSEDGLGNEEYLADYYWDRNLVSKALNLHNMDIRHGNIDKESFRSYKHKEVYIGHTSTVFWTIKEDGIIKQAKSKNDCCTVPMNVCNIWNLDTGGGYNGKLTIMDIDTKEYWQSDLLKELYPDHLGRT